jgi:hypothetical protein
MTQPTPPTVESVAAVSFDDVHKHIHSDYYVHRRASYDIAAIVAKLALDHPGAELADIDGDALWAIMEDRITCLHSPVSGMAVVHEEDLIAVADAGQHVECIKCERVFVRDAHLWVKP